MKILITPTEYAQKLYALTGKQGFCTGLIHAMKAYPEMPEGYWSEVLEASTKL